jgi:hypothetical protein
MISIKGFYLFFETSTPHAQGYFIECMLMPGTPNQNNALAN